MICMLVFYFGVKIFFKGIVIYFRKYQYSNVKMEVLWVVLSEVFGIDVNILMQNWIEKVGFFVLMVIEED